MRNTTKCDLLLLHSLALCYVLVDKAVTMLLLLYCNGRELNNVDRVCFSSLNASISGNGGIEHTNNIIEISATKEYVIVKSFMIHR